MFTGIGDSNPATFVFFIKSTFLETDRRPISKRRCASAFYIAVLAISFRMRRHGKMTQLSKRQ